MRRLPILVLALGLLIGSGQTSLGDPAKGGYTARPALYDRVFALCIGINDYLFQGMAPLRWAEKDAKDLSALLETKFGFETETLVGSKATRSSILEAMERYSESLGPNDALIVFFAGHGQKVEGLDESRSGFLVPHDAQLSLDDVSDIEEWSQQAVDLRSIGNLFLESRARHVVLFADVCYSGFLGTRSGALSAADIDLAHGRSRLVVTAGTEEQKVYEDDELQNGLFTEALLRQLTVDAPQSAMDVYLSIRAGVHRSSRGTMLPQYREVEITNGEFVFLPLSVTDVEAAVGDLEARARARGERETTEQDLIEIVNTQSYQFSQDAPRLQKAWERKFKRYTNNASLGNPLAMTSLTYCFVRGLGTEPDTAAAYQWARRAFDSGHPAGLHALAKCYAGGFIVPHNERLSMAMEEKAASTGFVVSRYGVAYNQKRQDSRDTSDSDLVLEYLREASDAGILHARSTLGVAAVEGWDGMEPDTTRAIEFFESAAKSGLPDAKYNLFLVWAGSSDTALQEKARHHLLDAADSGLGRAQVELAWRYFVVDRSTSVGFPDDPQKGVRWAELASQQGVARADHLLALAYHEGRGAEANWQKANHHLERAVDRNHDHAIWYLGTCYEVGKASYPKNKKKAESLYIRSATMNPGYAYALGRWYHVQAAWGTDDGDSARQWFLNAAQRGHALAADMILKYYNSDFYEDTLEFVESFPDDGQTWYERGVRAKYATTEFGDDYRKDTYRQYRLGDVSLHCYQMAAERGHAAAKEELKSGLASWWFERARGYNDRRLPVETMWCLAMAEAQGHPTATEQLDTGKSVHLVRLCRKLAKESGD